MSTKQIIKSHFIPFFALIFILIGCGGDDELLRPEGNTLRIDGLNITAQILEAGNTATLTALIDYSGAEKDLIYLWKATGGTIIGQAAEVTYLAPDAPGTYTITLEATDGFVAAQRSINVTVTATPSVSIASGVYWQGAEFTQTLKYRVNVTDLLRPDVKLRYEILQDKAQVGAFLSIHVNGTPFVEDEAIGEVQPRPGLVIDGEVDVSSLVNRPGLYEIEFTLAVLKVVPEGWQLRSARLVGAEGSSVRL